MHIKIPKRNKINEIMGSLKSAIGGTNIKVNTKKGAVVRNIIISIILLVVLTALIVFGINTRNSDTFNSPDNTKAKYLNEKNSSKIKETYSSKDSKERFLILVKDIELKIVNEYMNTITTSKGFDLAVKNLNNEFNKKEWKTIGIEKPKEWIGNWSVDKTGAIKFKFLNKQMEPDWVNDIDVSKYIVKN